MRMSADLVQTYLPLFRWTISTKATGHERIGEGCLTGIATSPVTRNESSEPELLAGTIPQIRSDQPRSARIRVSFASQNPNFTDRDCILSIDDEGQLKPKSVRAAIE
jgi:hypothetical protein